MTTCNECGKQYAGSVICSYCGAKISADMTLNEYQQLALQTANYPPEHGIVYTALGLAGEAGEVANKVKKWIRGDYKSLTESQMERLKVEVLGELGDSFWYIVTCAWELGFTLQDVANHNIDKLADRERRGVIKGNGDTR